MRVGKLGANGRVAIKSELTTADAKRRKRQTARVVRVLKLLWLLEDGLYPIAELQQKLGVSARTIYRDIQILRYAGQPVECRGGLYGLDDGG